MGLRIKNGKTAEKLLLYEKEATKAATSIKKKPLTIPVGRREIRISGNRCQPAAGPSSTFWARKQGSF